MQGMITRKEYMADSKKLHHEYYMQFAAEGMKESILSLWSKKIISDCYQEDEHLNNLPNRRGKNWMQLLDELTVLFWFCLSRVNKEINGEATYSLSGGTSTFKAIMKEIIQEA